MIGVCFVILKIKGGSLGINFFLLMDTNQDPNLMFSLYHKARKILFIRQLSTFWSKLIKILKIMLISNQQNLFFLRTFNSITIIRSFKIKVLTCALIMKSLIEPSESSHLRRLYVNIHYNNAIYPCLKYFRTTYIRNCFLFTIHTTTSVYCFSHVLFFHQRQHSSG